MLGEVLADRYEIQKELGKGGMGAVYAATHTGTGRRVALKVILEDKDQPSLRARFAREARAAGSIESRHVAHVLDVGIDEARGIPFIAMEYLEGSDLGHLIEANGALPPDVAMRIAAQACTGLAAAHAKGVVHRDLKPGNVFASEQDGELVIKLLDFGIAKRLANALDGSTEKLTRTGALLGSPLYMSPEQALGSKEVDLRTDVWSLGIVIFEMLSGHTPYEYCTGMGQLFMEICSEAPPLVTELAPWVSPEIAAFLERALRIEADERYQSASEMLAATKALTPGGTTVRRSDIVPVEGAQERQPLAPRPAKPKPKRGPSADHTVPVAVVLGPQITLPAAEAPGTGVVAPAELTAASRAKTPVLDATKVSGPIPRLEGARTTAAIASDALPRNPRASGWTIGAVLAAVGLVAGGAVFATRTPASPPVGVTDPPVTERGEERGADGDAEGPATGATVASAEPHVEPGIALDALPDVGGDAAPQSSVPPDRVPSPGPSATPPPPTAPVRSAPSASSTTAPAPSAAGSTRKNYGF